MNKFSGIHWSKLPNKDEIKRRMSESAKKRKPNFLGKHHLEETKKKAGAYE